MVYNEIANRKILDKGWSSDKKYCVLTQSDDKYLLRISPIEKMDKRKELYELFSQINELDIPICKPVEFGLCDEGVYTIYTWIEGEDADEVIPLLTDGEQYNFGVISGKYLKLLHTFSAPENQEDWHTRFNRKTDNKIKTYTECGLKFPGIAT